MITPSEIRQKALCLYNKAVDTWLKNNAIFFPKRIPADLKLSVDHSLALQSVNDLRQDSKGVVGFRYRVDWVEVNTRKYGRNKIPEAIWIDTLDDLLYLTSKR